MYYNAQFVKNKNKKVCYLVYTPPFSNIRKFRIYLVSLPRKEIPVENLPPVPLQCFMQVMQRSPPLQNPAPLWLP